MSSVSKTKSRIMHRPSAKADWGQEGATLLLALLFFLLCAVCGSVILASATASAGRMAGRGKNRQKYQSVEAAARLLENELHNASVLVQESEKITVTVEHVERDNDGEGESGEKSEETYTTTTYRFSGPDFLNADTEKSGTEGSGETAEGDQAEDAVAAAFDAGNGSNADLSMLEQLLTDANLTAYFEKGQTYQKAGAIVISDKDDETSEDADAYLSDCQDAWHMNFLTGNSEVSVKRHFTMELSGDAENVNRLAQDSLVEVELLLYGDGTLELWLSNGDSENADNDAAETEAADKYYMLLRGTAEVKTRSKSERTDQNFREDSDDESSETRITKKTSITWGDFVITKNAAEVGKSKETGGQSRSNRQDAQPEESSEDQSENGSEDEQP